MGCVMSAEEKAQQQMSRRIDDELAYEMAHRRSEVKLLLLGKKKGWSTAGARLWQLKRLLLCRLRIFLLDSSLAVS